jgi:hypothetical protein
MLVQRREESLRLVTQHEHALAAGEMATRWGGRSGRDPAPFLLVAAVGLHDVAWRPLDRRPLLDPTSGLPHSFDAHPLEPKLSAYRDGLDRMESCDPWIGLLGSRHYSSFLEPDRAPEFLEAEDRRRARLREELAERGRPVERTRLDRHLAVLQLLDRLSLVACLTGPDVPEAERLPWLRGPFRGRANEAFDYRWRHRGALQVNPYPFRAPFDVEFRCRTLPAGPYDTQEALTAAWRSANRKTLRVGLEPG